MKNNKNTNIPKIIQIPTISDQRGDISFFETGKDLDFEIKRVYYMHNVPNSTIRGEHGHKKLKQLLITLAGSIEISLDNGINQYNFTLSKPNEALYIPSGYYRKLVFRNNAICMVSASDIYDESDYIYGYEEFIDWVNNKNHIL